MSFGSRIIELRKSLKLSQTDVAEKVGIHKNVLGKYEREEVKPSIDVALKIAEFFGVSLDYLVGKVNAELDPDVTERILVIQNLPPKDQEYILFTLDALLRDAKSRFVYTQ